MEILNRYNQLNEHLKAISEKGSKSLESLKKTMDDNSLFFKSVILKNSTLDFSYYNILFRLRVGFIMDEKWGIQKGIINTYKYNENEETYEKIDALIFYVDKSGNIDFDVISDEFGNFFVTKFYDWFIENKLEVIL